MCVRVYWSPVSSRFDYMTTCCLVGDARLTDVGVSQSPSASALTSSLLTDRVQFLLLRRRDSSVRSPLLLLLLLYPFLCVCVWIPG